jgi:hypothetical protein
MSSLGPALFATLVVALTELASWFLVYRTTAYIRLVQHISKHPALDTISKKQQQDAAILNQSASDAKRMKQKEKKTAKSEQEFTKLQQQLAGFQLRTTVISLVLLLMAYQYLNATYDGIVVAVLPFEPWSLFHAVTHRGLKGENYREASAHLIFALALVVARTAAQKVMEYKGWRPVMPKLPSFWELAERQAEASVASK